MSSIEEWSSDMAYQQKRYLWIRTILWAGLAGAAAAVLVMIGDMTGLYEAGWMDVVSLCLAGGYFPGFLGGILSLCREQKIKK